MSKQQLGNYFAVSRNAKIVSSQKRILSDPFSELPASKKAAHTRFAYLTTDAVEPSSLNVLSSVVSAEQVTPSPTPSHTKRKPQKTTTLKGSSRGRKMVDLSKQATIPWSPVIRESSINSRCELKPNTTQKLSPSLSVTANDHEPAKSTKNFSVKPSSRSTTTLSRTLRSRRKASDTDHEQQFDAAEKSPVSCKTPVPAFERFAHLVESPTSKEPPSEAEPDFSKRTTQISSEIDLTQTDEKIPIGLPLPFDFRILLEFFRTCDTVVSMLYNRKELCSFDKLKPAVQEVVRRNFEESHVGQFLTVYPMVYYLRYEKQLDKYTHRPNGAYVLVLSPNLRTDGTQIGHDSPSKGHLIFTGTRLIQRRNRFHRLLLGIVMHAHREFLKTLPGINPSEIPNDSELRRWHPKFPLDSIVPVIKSSPLPIKPSDEEQKVTTAKDAVRAFQARALFFEAEACKNVAAAQLHSTLPSIPSPSKESACSPRKPTSFTLPSSNSSGAIPSVALFSSLNSSLDTVVTSSPMSSHLKGVSASLIAKVRARESERRLLTQLTQSHIPESRRAIYSRLPSFIPQVWTVMRTGNGRPLPITTVANRIAGGYHGGLSADAVMEHLHVILELCPFWIEKLDWTSVHLKVRTPSYSVKEILDKVKITLSKEGYQL